MNPETISDNITAEAIRMMNDPEYKAAVRQEFKTFLKKTAVKTGVVVAGVTAAVIVVKKIRNGEDPLEEVV